MYHLSQSKNIFTALYNIIVCTANKNLLKLNPFCDNKKYIQYLTKRKQGVHSINLYMNGVLLQLVKVFVEGLECVGGGGLKRCFLEAIPHPFRLYTDSRVTLQ